MTTFGMWFLAAWVTILVIIISLFRLLVRNVNGEWRMTLRIGMSIAFIAAWFIGVPMAIVTMSPYMLHEIIFDAPAELEALSKTTLVLTVLAAIFVWLPRSIFSPKS